MGYQLEGSLLEVCTCKVLCPCWIGEDPDGGTCDGVVGYHFDRGNINGVDVSGLSLVALAHIPGNVLQGNWRAYLYLDDKASPEQEAALLSVFSGKEGGPVADLVQLIGEVAGMERVPISFDVEEGQGRLRVGQDIDALMAPYKGATGQTTTLHESIFSTIPGAPAYIAKAAHYRANNSALGLSIDLEGHNAIQGLFKFEC